MEPQIWIPTSENLPQFPPMSATPENAEAAPKDGLVIEGRLGARRSGNSLRRDATAAFFRPTHSIFPLQDSGFARIWNP